ncbi:outer membrane protein OmpA-like peptidoglycan-associated protein [Lutibacter sp. Hel_I_33_5]|uniref:OmpA family protein n=1 Tax=Lutibacter sp. Hel_I_33_5 TaxID=1566289 RepID=UPI0011A002AC|nr:OmpA family protein [Lutibacter sp. Hel_I_33_5]TVZ56576.1 outer membrane protein OmpA-like peptidoglycan-associated protein [Lutibacter sp. Hel_I_33_5]
MKTYVHNIKKTIKQSIIVALVLLLGTTQINAQETTYSVYSVEGINTEGADFSPMYYKDNVVFASERPDKRTVRHRWGKDKRTFLDLYIAKVEDSTNLVKEIDYFSIDKLNTTYHESNAVFTNDHQTIYFTRNNYYKKRYKTDKKGINKLKLYKATRNEDDTAWKDLEELPFNSDEFSTGHPALSADNKTLYFTSDREGGFGKTDIYKVKINEDGSYGEVMNLGQDINTTGKEMFPFVTKDNKLYFSSDGRKGLGGLDIYKYNLNSKDKATSLGTSINSSADDFGIIINETQNPRRGYFSSNRAGGLGDDDIYGFTEQRKEEIKIIKPCEQSVTGYVRDKQLNIPLANAKVIIKQTKDSKTIATIMTDLHGKFSYKLPCNNNYTAIASKEYYKPDQDTFNTTDKAELALDLNFDLGLVDGLTYNDRNEMIINIKPIYFATNKSTIRPDAARELDYIVRIMNQYPKMIIKAASHTDSRGRDSYNEALSKRRAESTMNYITRKGISSNRITAQGYGETQLTNGCTNGVRCSKGEHQLNRRTEFIIMIEK